MSIKKTFVFVMLALIALPARAANDAQLLERAQKAFMAQQYKEAVGIYEELINQAPNDPRLLYNQGTAYAHLGENGMAQWRYLQALRFAPRDSMLRQNMSVIDPDYRSQVALTPLLPVNLIYEHFSANEWAAVAGITSIVALLLGSVALWRPRGSGVRLGLRKAAIIAAVIAAVAWPFAYGHYHMENVLKRGVIVSGEASVRSGPSENSTETWKLKAGTVVDITDDRTQPDWPLISFGGKGAGFISREQLRRL